MDIWEFDKAVLFLTLFMPGFISLKVYSLFIPGPIRDFSKSFIEAIGYSVLNFTALSWLIMTINEKGFSTNHQVIYYISLLLIFIVFPVLWPIIIINILKSKKLSKYTLNPIVMPWDYIFGQRKAHWVLVHLKDGRVIGGKYSKKSRTSAYPNERQIFLEEVWQIDKKGVFGEKVERTGGLLLFADEIAMVEFFN